jgi:hypothetical protein
MAKRPTDGTPEITAIGTAHAALKELDSSAQLRVLRYVAEMLGLTIGNVESGTRASNAGDGEPISERTTSEPTAISSDVDLSEETEGISAVALKWMKRAGLDPKNLQKLFSLGIDEIDLVAKSVPGTGKRGRMRNVLLLKGIAAYLGTGSPRVTFEQLKEASLHYDAYDATNFAAHIKSLNADVSGNKTTGFTLTPRGLTSATELIKDMLQSK